ncbi:MAG: hypothetical protein Q9171_003461 [Xanthocarpia ochracea]
MRPLLWYGVLVGFSVALWPQPKQVELGSSTLWLSPNVQFGYTPRTASLEQFAWLWTTVQRMIAPGSSPHNFTKSKDRRISTNTLLQSAFERMKHNVLSRGFVPRKFYPRGALFEPALEDEKLYIERVLIKEYSRQDMGNLEHQGKSEAYTIQVSKDGHALIEIASPLGALHALETFAQLFFAHSSSSGPYTPYAPLLINDNPTFEHRGLNLDIARNWISPADVMRTIEAMAASKLNKLHLHATDAQSWPIEIPALPELAMKGAYSHEQIWHTEDLEAVQLHGVYYGVEVFVEIDLPGHTTSIGNAYPHLVTAKDVLWPEYALEPPSGQLRLNSSEVPPFIESLLQDLLTRTSRYSSLFHLGGDELNLNAYLLDPTVRSSSHQVLQPLVQAFINHVISIAATHSLTVIMWEEMVLDWNLTLPSNVVVQTWRGGGDDALATILNRGYKTIFGSNAHWYLDCGHGYFIDPNPLNPDSPIMPPYLDYCSPYKNWRHMYAYDPVVDIPHSQKHLILGGEVHLWGELTDTVNLDGMLWPRVSAAAELPHTMNKSLPCNTTIESAMQVICNAHWQGRPGLQATTVQQSSSVSFPRPLKDPLPWYIHGSPLTLLFSSSGIKINEKDTISCDIAANRYIRGVLQDHGDGPIPPTLQLLWAHKSAILSIQHSPRMIYSNLVDVFTGIGTYQLTYGYFEVHFEILDKVEGIIGSGDIRSTRLTQANGLTTPTLPIERIFPGLIPPQVRNGLPDPPFVWPRGNARVKITFTIYGSEIAEQDTLTCYVAAANYVLQMIKINGDIQIDPNTFLHWTHGTASLTVQHLPRMRFGDLADVLAALVSFQSVYGFTEAAFQISHNRHGILGAGSVESRDAVKNITSSPWILSIPPNATALPTLSASANTTINWTLPPDPMTVHVPDSSLSLTFSHYGRAIPAEDFFHAWILLTQRVTTELLRGKKDEPMLEALYVKHRRVLIAVGPEVQMTWGKLAMALEGITEFLSRWSWLSCNFVVGADGVGTIGDGFVMYI